MPCEHCPRAGSPCRGEDVPRLCQLVDPTHPAYNPEYLSVLEPADGPPFYPSLAQQAMNFAGAVASHVASGLAVVSEDEQDRRLAICRSCSSFDVGDSRCRECGCYMEVKARWESGACPAGKW